MNNNGSNMVGFSNWAANSFRKNNANGASNNGASNNGASNNGASNNGANSYRYGFNRKLLKNVAKKGAANSFSGGRRRHARKTHRKRHTKRHSRANKKSRKNRKH